MKTATDHILEAQNRTAGTPERGPSSRHALTFQVSRFTFHAFTLLELLVVISIIALLAAIALPTVSLFKPNYTASATRQLLDDLSRARQLAISQHTTVLMVFVETNFWSDPAVSVWRQQDWVRATNLFDKQLIGYSFVSLRSMGDQPGRPTPRYLSRWKTLPAGASIAWQKYALPNNLWFPVMTNNLSGNPVLGFKVAGFNRTCRVPFPLVDTPVYNANKQPYVWLPYIAFDYLGRLTDDTGNILQPDAYLPLAKGSVSFSRNAATKAPMAVVPKVSEEPPGNATNSTSYNMVCIDWLTGRAHVERQEVQ